MADTRIECNHEDCNGTAIVKVIHWLNVVTHGVKHSTGGLNNVKHGSTVMEMIHSLNIRMLYNGDTLVDFMMTAV